MTSNAKNVLQEYFMSRRQAPPEYSSFSSGEAHAPTFLAQVRHSTWSSPPFFQGSGGTKKEAE